MLNHYMMKKKPYTYVTFKLPILTVIIGAKCIDGVVMVADKKVTDYSGNTKYYTNKIFADSKHILIGYGEAVDNF